MHFVNYDRQEYCSIKVSAKVATKNKRTKTKKTNKQYAGDTLTQSAQSSCKTYEHAELI